MQVSPGRDISTLKSIWIVPSVVLLLACGLLVWVSYDEYRETIKQENRFLDAHTRIAQSQLTGLLRNVKQLLTRVAEEWPELTPRQRKAYATILAARNREVPEIRTLALIDAAGRVETAANPVLKGFDASQRSYFTAHRDRTIEPNFFITRPFKSSFGDYSISFSVAMYDKRHRFLGVAVAGVNYKYFESVMKEIQPKQRGSIVGIVNDDGDVAFRLPSPDKYIGRNVAASAAFQTFMRSGRQPTSDIGVSQVDGVKRIYAYRAVDNTPLSVLVASPYHDVLATWRHDLIARVVLLALAVTVILRLAWIAHHRHQEVLAGKEFSERLIETANAIVVGVDAESRVVTVNDAAERITGYRREELVGRSFFDTAMPRDRFPRIWKAFAHSRETGLIPRAFEAPILTKGGEVRVIAWQNNGTFAHGEQLAILAFGIDVTERAQLQQLRNREEISRRLVGIQEEERRRLAIELHDRTSPNLTILGINLKLLARLLPKDAAAELVHLIEDASATLTDTIDSIRSASFDFRPPLLDYAGLWSALNAYAQQFRERTGIAVRIAGQRRLRLAPEVETNLFHIVQEALVNCARHSRASHILIRQTSQGGDVILMIADDGVGFESGDCPPGQGLAMMRQRAAFIGGRFFLDTHPNKGTSIAVKFKPCPNVTWLDAQRNGYASANQARRPRPAAYPLAKQAVSR